MVERRRDGRIDYSNPHLIDLLRRPTSCDSIQPAEPDSKPEHEIDFVMMVEPPASAMSALPFIIVGCLFFWGVIGVLLWKTMFR
jgi:hypothetical protein